MVKTTHATIRISTDDHHLSLSVKFKKESNLLEKFEQILEIISYNNYLANTTNKLESIFFFESEEI